MNLFLWIVRAIIFSVVLLFAINNTDPVILKILPGFPELTLLGPLVVWLFLAFILGVITTFLILLPSILRNWKVSKRNAN